MSDYRYASTSAGKVGAHLRGKRDGSGDLQVAAAGNAAFAIALPLSQDPSVTVQLHAGGGACWSSTFAAPTSRSDAGMFKDRVD